MPNILTRCIRLVYRPTATQTVQHGNRWSLWQKQLSTSAWLQPYTTTTKSNCPIATALSMVSHAVIIICQLLIKYRKYTEIVPRWLHDSDIIQLLCSTTNCQQRYMCVMMTGWMQKSLSPSYYREHCSRHNTFQSEQCLIKWALQFVDTFSCTLSLDIYNNKKTKLTKHNTKQYSSNSQ